MGFAGLVINQETANVMGVSCIVRKHSVAFRQYAQLLALEGRVMEFDADGRPLKIVDAGSLELYRKIVRATIVDGLVSWDLKRDDGTGVGLTDAVLIDLERDHSDFLTELFDRVEEFNRPLSASKKK